MENKEFERNEDKTVIYADIREEKSTLFHILSKRCDLRKKQLSVADYQLSEDVALERKTIPDFLQSLIDGRLMQQLTDMKQNFPKPIVLIEGNDNIYSLANIHPNAIRGAFAAIATDFQIPILWTKTPLESAEIICTIAKREQFVMKRSVVVREKTKFRSENQQQEFLIAGLPSISGTLAKRLLKHFGSPQKIFSATEEELSCVEGIGKNKAKKIREILSKEYEKSILED